MMRILTAAGALVLAFFATSAPATACMAGAELVLEDVRFADAVLVGTIANYEVVTPVGQKPGHLPDYARFDFLVDEVLKGSADRRLTVTWDNSTFGEPDELPPGQYLIAVRNPKSTTLPPLRGPSGTIFPRPEPNAPTLLQAPCASPFLFGSTSEEASKVRKIVKTAGRKL